MNTALDMDYDEAYEARLQQKEKRENTANYNWATEKYIQEVGCYEETLGKPVWVDMDGKRYGTGDAVKVMMIEHTMNPDYYVAYFLTPAGYVCVQRHTALYTWENLCSENPAPEWFINSAKNIRKKSIKRMLGAV